MQTRNGRSRADADIGAGSGAIDAVDTAEHEAVARINSSIGADGRSVGEIVRAHIRKAADGRVVTARGVVEEHPAPLAVLSLPVVLLSSACQPLAVFSSPVVLFKSAQRPVAVLPPPVVLSSSAATPLAVLSSPYVLL